MHNPPSRPDHPGHQIRRVRQQRGLTIRGLAAAAGVSTTTLQRIEAGEDTKLSALSALATALHTYITIPPQETP